MRGIANPEKRRSIFDKHRQNADILILQETHSEKSSEHIWENEWGGNAIFSHGSSVARGVAIFTSKMIFRHLKNIYRDDEGRILVVDLHQDEHVVTLVVIYAPNQDNPSFFRTISNELKKREAHKIIIGDFNLTLDVDLDRENTYSNNNKSLGVVEEICEEFCLCDIWRVQNQEKREFSWIKPKLFPRKASRIDFALVSKGIDQKIATIQYVSSVMTDHRGVYMVIQFTPFERGRGYWKLNTSMLSHTDYVHGVNVLLDDYLATNSEQNPSERWELLKKKVKTFSVQYAREQVREDRIIIANLSEKVNEYEENLPLNRDDDELYEKTKIDLEDKTLKRIQGVMFRSKARWQEEGERNTKYFFSLEKIKYNAKTCYSIIDGQGNEVNNPDDILAEQKSFYHQLYQEDKDVGFTLSNVYGVKVPPEVKAQQDQQISVVDLEVAIKTMNNNKTPGQDGIPVDFYKVFWNKLKNPFCDMMLHVFDLEILHPTARRGILNLIPKGNKDSRFIKNLRPITLLNTDYKIIEKAIANKMIPALENIISKDQRGFMKDRRISVNIRKMLDIMHLAAKEDIEAVILSLDFVKCFDKCSFKILHDSLDFFEFGSMVRKWTEILYKDFTVVIQNNGHFSSSIDIQKGVHQGGCCSSVYFLVIAEILALALRENQDIEGITFQDIRNLLNQFADDMDVFSLATEKSLKAIFSELEHFRLQSGFTISYEKTTLYRIGSLRHSNAMMYNISDVVWSNNDITVLGVQITHEDIVSKNYETLIEKAKKVLSTWHNRALSLIGKIQVVNTLVSSLFVYKMMVLPRIPLSFVKKIDSMIREYIWGGKKAKIAYSVLQLNKDQGGLRLVHLTNKDKALKATWPKILYSECDYSEVVYTIMKCGTLGSNIWRCRIHPLDVKTIGIREQFWEDVLESWSEYNYYVDFRIENQIIWYNSNIKIAGKMVMWSDVHNKGLIYVHQLFHSQEYKSAEQVYREYGLTVLRYNSLKAALPKEWKDFFLAQHKATMFPLPPHTYDMYIHGSEKKLASKVYNFLAEDVLLIHNKYLKWKQELGQDFSESLVEFGRMHLEFYKVTNITKFRSFQYRILQRALVTNVLLSKWGLVETNLCSFCGEHIETLRHMFCECVCVIPLWQNLLAFIQQEYGVKGCNISNENIIFNRICDKKCNIANFLCLVTKQFIYSQRCMRGQLSFTILKTRIRALHNVEKYIAVKNNRSAQHVRKWYGQVADQNAGLCNTIQQYVEDM